MQTIISGFGPFNGVDDNPTKKIIQYLQQDYVNDNVQLSVIEVSVNGVISFQSKIKAYPGKKLIVHLGVNSRGERFDLERFAYNNMTFRAPDEAGLQPDNQLINVSDIFDKPMETDIALDDVARTLVNEGFPVAISNDPGRFVCNYTYYQSMQTQYLPEDSKLALFIHVPLEEVIPLEHQIAFVKRTVAILTEMYCEKP
eukprot:gene3049-5975_t